MITISSFSGILSSEDLEYGMTTLGDDTEAYGTQESQSGVQVTQADYMPRGLATPTPCVGSSASSLPHYPIAHGQALPEHANSPYARYYALAPAADDHLSLGGYYPPAPGIPDRPLFGRYYGLAPGVADRHSAGTASYAVDPALHAPTSGSYAVQFSSGGASSAGAEQARPDIPGMVEEPQFRMQYRYSHRHVLNGHQGRDPGSENGQLGHTGHMPYRLSPFDLLGDVSVAPSTSSIASVTHAGGWEIVDSVGLTYGQAPDTGSWCPLNPQCTHARGRRPLGSQEEFQAHMQEHRQSLDGYLHLTGNSTLLCPGVDAGCLYDKLYCLYSADCERGLHGKTGVPCKDVRAWKAHMKNHFVKESGRHSCPTCGKSFGRKHELSTHIDAKHAKIKSHQCDQCDHSASDPSNLKKHKDSVHNDKGKVQCGICHQWSIKGNLKRHQQSQKCSAGACSSVEVDQADHA